jgi:IS30 family transposase
VKEKKKITFEDRKEIEKCIRMGESLARIERTLGFGGGTISMEVKRNGGRHVYDSISAQEKSDNSRKKPHTNVLEKNLNIIKEHLRRGLSVNQTGLILNIAPSTINSHIKEQGGLYNFLKEDMLEGQIDLFETKEPEKNTENINKTVSNYFKNIFDGKNKKEKDAIELLQKIMKDIKEFFND